jgi:hypothetical protein
MLVDPAVTDVDSGVVTDACRRRPMGAAVEAVPCAHVAGGVAWDGRS